MMAWINKIFKKENKANINIYNIEKELQNIKKLVNCSRSPGLFSCEEDFLTERLLAHPVKKVLPDVKLSSHKVIKRANRWKVSERLLTAYNKAIGDGKHFTLERESDDLWSDLISRELVELVDILQAQDVDKLADFITEFGSTYTWFGGVSTSIDGFNKNLNPQHVAITYLDKLICLGEYLGVLNVENPEFGAWGNSLHENIDALINEIEAIIGIDITPPMGIIHTDGIATSKGVFHYRHINSLYIACRISCLNESKGAVYEFGGGLGIAAMYAHRLGFHDYTILDLPITCLLSGHYLINALGEECVSLYGEKNTKKTIKILPYWECLNTNNKAVEVTINQDGFPEMSENLIFEYIKQISRFTRGYFLSMNHEYSFPKTVNNIIKNNKNFNKLYRFKSWCREGYVEEAYRILK